jgi:hypothetical protein
MERPSHDPEIANLLRDASVSATSSADGLRRLNERIMAAALPMLDELAPPQCTVWDYAEHWSRVLLPIGALAAVAAGLCLFALSSDRLPPAQSAPPRVALLGAATNRVSSQNLIDLLVSNEAATAVSRRSGR